jgi:DNA-binding beta-propeller fold protein YncE
VGETRSFYELKFRGRTLDVTIASLPMMLWAVLRIPLILLVAVIFSNWIITHLVDPIYFTVFVINLVGTPFARLLLFLAFAGLFVLLRLVTRPLGETRGYWVMIIATAVGSLILFRSLGTPQRFAGVVTLLLATNLLPNAYFESIPARVQRFVMTAVPGVGEFFFTSRYLDWVVGLARGRTFNITLPLLPLLPGVLAASGAAAAFLHSPHLVRVEQALRLPSTARVIARADFNWVELDSAKRYLFVGGHGVQNLLRYDVRNLDQAPLQSPVDAGAPQAFAYDPAASELLTYNGASRTILVMDATALTLKRSMPVVGLAPGDSWIAVDHATDTVTIVSEADVQDGKPFMVLDRTTGAPRDQRDIDAGNLVLEPGTSRLFLSFFRRSNRLMVYDLKSLKITADVATRHYIDRMALVESKRELLLVAPAQSRIVRVDADTLAPKGEIKALFGVRTLAVDEDRKLLLTGSLATGEISVLSLEDFSVRSRVYLGPWLRTIQIDSARGIAYVSSNGALYEYQYAPTP